MQYKDGGKSIRIGLLNKSSNEESKLDGFEIIEQTEVINSNFAKIN